MINTLSKYNITLFGDSIARGLYIEDSTIKKNELNAINLVEENFDIKINNNSNFGQTLKRLVEKNTIDKYLNSLSEQNNVLVINLGGNDSDFNWKEVAQSPQLNHQSKTDIKDYEKLLNYIIDRAREKDVKVMFATILPVDSVRYFNNVISATADKNTIMEFFHNDVTNISRVQETFNSVIIKTSIQRNVPLIDLRKDMLLQRDYLTYFHQDGVHPNNKGHMFLAEEIGKFINNCI